MNPRVDREIREDHCDGVYFMDRDCLITYWSKEAEQITGYSAQQATGCACREDLLDHVTAEQASLCQADCPLAAVMEDGIPREAEVFVQRADGSRLPVVIHAMALRDRMGTIIGAIEAFRNPKPVTNPLCGPGKMDQIPQIDSLTKIGNRLHLQEHLQTAIGELKHTQATAGLLFMDIDHFKQVNETYGRHMGDKVLCMVADTFRDTFRSTDPIGRWGDEEFVAILRHTVDKTTLFRIAEKTRKRIEASHLDEAGQSLSVTISIGATCLSADDTSETVIARAGGLMVQSKRAGRNRVTAE